MNNSKYYDGTKLLSLLDKNGNRPEIYICTSNRTAGKTTYFGRLAVNRFKNNGEKFALLYRYNYELDDCAMKFFKDIGSLFFPSDEMTSKRVASGIFHELYLNDKPCGYAISINSVDQIKKYSHLFSDVGCIIFDEFQSETNHYCQDEINKFQSVHTSIARGQGKQTRYVPVYMISNPVSLINPYYVAMGISNRLNDKVHFLKGNGFVLEQGFNEMASKAQQESAFNQAFAGSDYLAYSTQNVYLNDNQAFIEEPQGKRKRYVITLKYQGKNYGVREFPDLGIIYCDDKPDMQFPYRLSITTDDHNINYVMLNNNAFTVQQFRDYFNKGCFRFKDLKCKEVIISMIGY